MSKRIRIKVNGTIPGHPPGSIVVVNADERGTPLDASWRRRLRDAEVDECCEVVQRASRSTSTRKRITKPADQPAEPAGNESADGSEA